MIIEVSRYASIIRPFVLRQRYVSHFLKPKLLMGVASSNPVQTLKSAIETQNINAILSTIKYLNLEQIKTLLQTSIDIDNHRCTLLHYAVWQGNSSKFIAEFLDRF